MGSSRGDSLDVGDYQQKMGGIIANLDPLEKYLSLWHLSEPVLLASTFTSEVFRVQSESSTAVLKILKSSAENSEARSSTVLRFFNGHGAVKLLNSDQGAHLLEFVDGPQLRTVVDDGNDDQATEILCDVLNQIHQNPLSVPEGLISMERNFRSLFSKIRNEESSSIYRTGAELAEKLIATEQETKVLHGDIHHENILKSTARGWLAIDPKCVAGERTYDTANAFYNPIGLMNLTESLETIKRRSQIFSHRLGLDRKRILEYAFAYGCLRAAWCLEDGRAVEDTLRVAQSIYETLRKL